MNTTRSTKEPISSITMLFYFLVAALCVPILVIGFVTGILAVIFVAGFHAGSETLGRLSMKASAAIDTWGQE